MYTHTHTHTHTSGQIFKFVLVTEACDQTSLLPLVLGTQKESKTSHPDLHYTNKACEAPRGGMFWSEAGVCKQATEASSLLTLIPAPFPLLHTACFLNGHVLEKMRPTR